MVKTGAGYQPELVELMKLALDEAANTLPAARQTSAMKIKLASRILSAAARGVRDPIKLRWAALLEIEDEFSGRAAMRHHAVDNGARRHPHPDIRL
jgi:hypothetical protein